MTVAVDFADALRGYTNLRRMEFSVDVESGLCRLVLELANEVSPGARALHAEFQDVSNFSVSEFGGGYTQLLLLSVEDISDRQLDRIKYEVREMERDAISFFCQRISLSS